MNRTIYYLALQTILWIPVCGAIWYWFGELQTHWAGVVVGRLIDYTFPFVIPMRQQDSSLVFDIRRAAEGAKKPDSSSSFQATIKIDALVHGSGLPLFVALMLASPSSSGNVWRTGTGMLLLQTYAIISV